MQVCTSLQTENHASTPPLCFLQAGCPSCRPTNSVKALKAPALKAPDTVITSLHYLLCRRTNGFVRITVIQSGPVLQEMKWVVFFCKKVENGEGGCKKVDLSSSQGALCTVSVFFILHWGVRMHPTHPLPTGLLAESELSNESIIYFRYVLYLSVILLLVGLNR